MDARPTWRTIMQRTAVVVILGIALGFASIPGIIALSFSGGSSPSDNLATQLDSTNTVIVTVSVTDSLAMDMHDDSGCPRESGPDASQF